MALKLPNNFCWSVGPAIGSGGQGTVYLAEDVTGRYHGKFALKRLGSGKPAKAYERFVREIHAASQLDHPSIARVVDHSNPQDSFQFYVMEYFEHGQTLKQLMRSGENPFYDDVKRSLAFFRSLIEAIDVWNKVGIVHRDLSPANIIVLKDHSVKVIDFGLCQIDDGHSFTLTDEGVGTPNYMAPECESGSTKAIGIAADIYSAGKVLWSAITNRFAFSRESPVFREKSMRKMLPGNPAAAHFHYIFERTIRNSPDDRCWEFGEWDALFAELRRLIDFGFPPLELLDDHCPHCRMGKLGSFAQSHVVFGNPNPSGIQALQCNMCGFCFARATEVRNSELLRRLDLS